MYLSVYAAHFHWTSVMHTSPPKYYSNVVCMTFYFQFHFAFTQENAFEMLDSNLRKLWKTSRYVSNSSRFMSEIGACTTFKHI